MRRLLRKLRDNPVVLGGLVAGMRAAQLCGVHLSERAFQHVPYRGLVRVDCGEGKSFHIHSRGGRIENGLFWRGLRGHEPESISRWIDYAAGAQCVLDIGANVGVYSLIAAAVGSARIHAFEPIERIRRILQQNVDVNAFDHVSVWGYCVGNRQGKLTMYDPGGEAPLSASASPSFVQERLVTEKVQQISVETTSVDAFCAQQNIEKVDLVKIDVEGFEASVLEGMQQTIADSRPVILMEVLEPLDGKMIGILEELRKVGYRIERIHEGGGHADFNLLLTFTSFVPSP